MRLLSASMINIIAFSGLCNSTHVKMEKLIERKGFLRKGRAFTDLHHEVIFHVKQLNMDILEQIVAQRSSPSHEKYQTWLSFQEIGLLTSNAEGSEKVVGWLNHNQIEVMNKINEQYLFWKFIDLRYFSVFNNFSNRLFQNRSTETLLQLKAVLENGKRCLTPNSILGKTLNWTATASNIWFAQRSIPFRKKSRIMWRLSLTQYKLRL